jgi:hypothetical protein
MNFQPTWFSTLPIGTIVHRPVSQLRDYWWTEDTIDSRGASRNYPLMKVSQGFLLCLDNAITNTITNFSSWLETRGTHDLIAVNEVSLYPSCVGEWITTCQGLTELLPVFQTVLTIPTLPVLSVLSVLPNTLNEMIVNYLYAS